MKSLVWLRNDLRMDDNPALRQACIQSNEVHCIYIFSNNQNQLHNQANCKTEFIISNLIDLNKSLNKINIPLTVINSNDFNDNELKIIEIVNERGINKVFWNNMFGEDEQLRDLNVSEMLTQKNIEFETFNDQVVFNPGTIKTQENKPYSVFTPFKRRWIENFNIDLLDIEFEYSKKR